MIINLNRKLIFLLCTFVIVGVGIYGGVQVFDTHIEDDPLLGKSNFEIGQYYFNHDGSREIYDLDLARIYYEKSVNENPVSHNMAWYQLGRIDFLEGEFDAALDKFQNQLNYFSADIPEVYYMIGLTYGFKARKTADAEDWIQAVDNFNTYITYAQTAPWPRVDLAWLYFSQGKFEEMKPVLEPILTLHGDNPWILNMYGLALMNTSENQAEALPYFYQAREESLRLGIDDWGAVYPGNNPEHWGIGLKEFQGIIEKNIALLE